jgi:hypothetical protein
MMNLQENNILYEYTDKCITIPKTKYYRGSVFFVTVLDLKKNNFLPKVHVSVT